MFKKAAPKAPAAKYILFTDMETEYPQWKQRFHCRIWDVLGSWDYQGLRYVIL